MAFRFCARALRYAFASTKDYRHCVYCGDPRVSYTSDIVRENRDVKVDMGRAFRLRINYHVSDVRWNPFPIR